MNIGKLHQVKKYYWLLYPSKDIAAAPPAPAARPTAEIVEEAAYWSNRFFNCNVSYISPNSIFCLLTEEGNYHKVLTSNGEMGWIFYPEGLSTKGLIEEVKE